MLKKIAILFLLAPVITLAVNLGGYYEIQTRVTEDGVWQLFEPSHRFELKLYSSPWNNTEGFFKLHGELSRLQDNDAERVLREYTLLEGHLKYRWEKHFEVKLFTRQNSYWFPQVFELVNSDKMTGDGNSQGIRTDFWNLGPVHGVGIYSDFSGSTGEDASVLNINVPFWDNRIKIGSTAGRKDWGETTSDYNSFVAGDAYLSLGRIIKPLSSLGNIDITGQLVQSRVAGESDSTDDIAWLAEIRQLKLGPIELQASYHHYGADFRSYLSNQFDTDQKYNEDGLYLKSLYFFPTKAINLTASYSETRAPENRTVHITDINPEKTNREVFGEAYIEWVYDIKTRFYYKYYRGWDSNYGDYKTYPSIFGELSVENNLAKIRSQVKVKDIGTPYQIIATGVELNVNITDDLKLYARAINAMERYESRQTVFIQLRYDRFQPAEIFLEFGNPGDSDNDLTNDDDFVSESANHGVNKQVKLFVKVYF